MAGSIPLVFILSHLMVRLPAEAQVHMGCFTFISGNNVLSVKTQNVGSVEACVMQCQSRRDTYAGVRYGRFCYCGDNHNHTVNGPQLGDSSCTTTCDEDRTPRCGGQFSINIYSVCSRGLYHDNTTADGSCNASCNCKDGHICLYRTGSCPANCESGWRGEACNKRVVQSTTEAATPTVETDNGVAAALPDKGATVTMSSGTSKSTNNVAGTGPSERLDDDKDGISVTAVAVGVSVAVLVLVAMIALIVYFRIRRKPYKSGDEIDEGTTTPEVKTDYSKAKQTENEPTIYTATESPEPCYSSVDYLSNGPANNNGEDIPKSDDDVAINGELEMVEYAVVKKPGDGRHVNLKENSLYGTNDGDSDE